MLKNPSRNSYIRFASFALPALLALAACIARGFSPFGESTILTGDLHSQFLPYLASFRDSIAESGFFYTFSKQLGGSMFMQYIQYLVSPLDWLYFLLPTTLYPQLTVCLFILRAGMSGYACLRCIEYIRGRLDTTTLCLSCSYALMGYEMAYFQAPSWQFFILITPVIALLVERLIREGRFGFYIAALTLSVLHFYYLGYMLCIFIGIFFFYRLFLAYRLTSRQKLNRTLVFLGASALAVGVCAFYLIPSVLEASANKGGLFALDLALNTNFNPVYLISKFFVGSFAWNNITDGLPILYCGVLSAIMALLFFCDKSVDKKERAASAGVLLLFFLVMWLKPLNLLLHGGSPPNWFPYRYTFLICFFIVFTASGAISAPSVKKASFLAVLLVVFAALGHLFSENIPSGKRTLFTLFAALCYLAYFYLKGRGTSHILGKAAGFALVLLVSAELALNAYFTMSVFEYYPADEFTNFITGWGSSFDSVEGDGSGFYRVEKTDIRTYNDPMWLGYNGLSYFGSQKDATDYLLQKLYYENSAYGRGSTAFADAFLGFKYVLSDDGAYAGSQYNLFDSSLAHPAYISRYTLPLCFVSSGDILSGVKFTNTFEYQNAALRGLAGSASDYFFPCAYQKNWQSGAKSGIITLKADREGYYYAVLSLESNDGAEIFVNDVSKGIYGNWKFSRIVDLGLLAAGAECEIRIVSQNESMGLGEPLVYCLERESFESAYEQLKAGALLDAEIRPGYVSGRAFADEGDILATTLLYSSGWEITVNGSKVSGEQLLDGLLAVPLQTGENNIEMAFMPPGFKTGVALTALCLIAAAAWVFAEKRREKKSVDT